MERPRQQNTGFRVQGLGFRVQGLGFMFRVSALNALSARRFFWAERCKLFSSSCHTWRFMGTDSPNYKSS